MHVVLTEKETVRLLKNWGVWRHQQDFPPPKKHIIYRWMEEFGDNPMTVFTKMNVEEHEAMIVNQVLHEMIPTPEEINANGYHPRNCWYEIAYGRMVEKIPFWQLAKECGCKTKTARRKWERVIGHVMEHARIPLEIYDLEKELL